jgi:hypothetical protein
MDIEKLKHATKVCLLAAFNLIFWLVLLFLLTRPAHSAVPPSGGTGQHAATAPHAGINIEKLATAIYWAEGGPKTRHPYGILAKYKSTTPRQACINTIKHALRDWSGKGDFIAFLGRRYCPVGAKNDPTGLNKNWIKNVTRLYNK